jgi:hypothetical protein
MLRLTLAALAAAAAFATFSCGGGGNGGTGGGSGGSGGGTGGGSGACDTLNVTSGWQVYLAADGGPNPTVGSASGSVKSCTTNNKTRVILDVTLTQPDGGPSANRAYGAHVHVNACDVMQAGGHYKNDPDAGASATNELWLDFTTDATGHGTADKTADWTVRTGQAKAVVIHANMTDAMGAAGAKLVCVGTPF